MNPLLFTSKIDARNVLIYEVDKKFPKLSGLQNGSDYEIEPNDFTVQWYLELDAREWGVKNFSWAVTDIAGSFDIVYFDENGDEKDRESVEFDVAPFNGNFQEGNDIDGRSLSINDIEIDYASMSVFTS